MNTKQTFSVSSKRHYYNDSCKNRKNEAQKIAEWEAKRIKEELITSGKVIISMKPVHYKNSVRIEISYTE